MTLTLTGTIVTAAEIAEEARAAERARIKARRDIALHAGTVVAGIPIATDDTSQQRITGAALAASLDPNLTVQWKTSAGFVALTATQVLAIAQAIRAHVQACFDREAALLAALEAEEAYDIETGWP